jgi:hypothetical protein
VRPNNDIWVIYLFICVGLPGAFRAGLLKPFPRPGSSGSIRGFSSMGNLCLNETNISYKNEEPGLMSFEYERLQLTLINPHGIKSVF